MANSTPALVLGQTPAASQWNAFFGGKVDASNGEATGLAMSSGTITSATLSGTFPGNHTYSGNVTYQGTVTVQGTLTAGAVVSAAHTFGSGSNNALTVTPGATATAPVVATQSGSGGLTVPGPLTVSRAAFATYPPPATGLLSQQDFTYNLPTTAIASTYWGNQFNFTLSGDPRGSAIWHNLDKGTLATSSTAVADVVMRATQAIRTNAAADTTMRSLVAQALDQTGQPSSIAGGLAGLEVDIAANGIDDATLTNRNRSGITVVASRAVAGTNAEFKYMLGGFVTNAFGFYSLMVMPPFRDVGIDFRTATTWGGAGTAVLNAVWFRTGHVLALDTSAVARLSSDGTSATISAPLKVGAGTTNVLTVTPGAASTNRVVFSQSGTGGFGFATGPIVLPTLTNAANDAAAATAGVIVGQIYRNGSVLMQRVA